MTKFPLTCPSLPITTILPRETVFFEKRNINTGAPSSEPVSDDTLGVEWAEHDFVQVADASLESISETVSSFGFDSQNGLEDFDIDLSQGVLTVQLGSVGTFVLNTQTPNRQIWMSSPISGPWRYAWHPQRREWLSTRDGHCLSERLSHELAQVFDKSVTISFNQVSIDNL